MTDEEFMVSVIEHLQYISKQLRLIEQNTSETKDNIENLGGDLSSLTSIESDVTDILCAMPVTRRIPEKKPPQKKKKGSK